MIDWTGSPTKGLPYLIHGVNLFDYSCLGSLVPAPVKMSYVGVIDGYASAINGLSIYDIGAFEYVAVTPPATGAPQMMMMGMG